MVDDRDNDDSIHKVDTVPPPAGDDDAYNSPTKVGPASQDAWAELIRKANEEGERNAAASGPASRSFPSRPGPTSDKAPASKPAPISAKPAAAPAEPAGPLPRVYDEADDDDAATKLSDSARGRMEAQAAAAVAEAPPPLPASPPPPAPTPTTPSVAPAPPVATLPSVPAHLVKPLAFQPGDPALPAPAAPRKSLLEGRALVITGVICVLIFAVGLTVFLFAR